MNAKLNSRIKLHLDAKLQNEETTHSNFEVIVRERDVEIHDRIIHSDSEPKR